MAEVANIPRNPLLGLGADALARIKQIAGSMAASPAPNAAPIGALLNMLMGEKAKLVDDASYGFPPTTGSGQATQIKPEYAGDVADVVPWNKAALVAKGVAGELAKGGGAAALAGMIKGPKATTWNPVAAQAAEILSKNRTPEEVHAATGLWRPPAGQDQAWRGEFSDEYASLTDLGRQLAQKVRNSGLNEIAPVEKVLHHRELYRNYPSLIGTEVEIRPGDGGFAQHSVNDPTQFRANIGAENPRNILLHELTHILQAKEGFNVGGAASGMISYGDLAKEAARVGNWGAANLGKQGREGWTNYLIEGMQRAGNSTHSAYMRIPGEAEARNVEARRYMGSERLRSNFPYSTYDVPLEEVLWKYWNDWGKQP